MEQLSLSWELPRKEYTVSELTTAIRGLLSERFSDIWVSGEISGAKRAPSGHWYFTLKDEFAQIRCVCFRNSARLLKFQPEDGLAVRARGRVDVFEVRGDYQFQVEALEPLGLGALQLAFEQLKKKLTTEGLFASERKRPLPALPWRIGIVTSPQGAAIRDMINVLKRRLPGVHIRIYPALVQGEGAAATICEGIEYFSREAWADLVIVGRGGGSIEDLWAFNEESVARAIAACTAPVISAVGHETDFTIADFVADCRAPTPSAAAEIAVPTRESLLDRIAAFESALSSRIRLRLASAARRLDQLSADRASGTVHRRIGRAFQRLDELDYRSRSRIVQMTQLARRRFERLHNALAQLDPRLRLLCAARVLERLTQAAAAAVERRLAGYRADFDRRTAQLAQLSPLRILERGYAIVEARGGRLVKSPEDAPAGEKVHIRLAKGELTAKVLGGATSK